MSRGLRPSIVCLFSAWAVASLRAGETTELKILARASDPNPVEFRLEKDDSGAVIRDARELVAHSIKLDSADDPAVQKEMEKRLALRLMVKQIDWSKQMVLVAQGQPTRGEYGNIKFESPRIERTVIMVPWIQERRVTRVAYNGPPIGFCLVERFDGEVKFLPRQITNSNGMKLAMIPAGKFLMGSPKNEPDRLDDEKQHEVEITRPFYMGTHEVTVRQFTGFVLATKYQTEAESDGKGGRAFDGKEFTQKPEFTWKKLHFAQSVDDPVVVVTWSDAVAFCAWMSKREGMTYRLPTEAEWEYACRAGTNSRFNTGDGDEDLKIAGNIADASLKKKWADASWAMTWDDRFPFTAPVGKFRANAFGLHDMHGNAWEWCSDWYGEDYYAKSPTQDPQGPATGKERIARGGAWSTQPKFCRSAFRDWHEPGYRSDCVGFRVVASWTK